MKQIAALPIITHNQFQIRNTSRDVHANCKEKSASELLIFTQPVSLHLVMTLQLRCDNNKLNDTASLNAHSSRKLNLSPMTSKLNICCSEVKQNGQFTQSYCMHDSVT